MGLMESTCLPYGQDAANIAMHSEVPGWNPAGMAAWSNDDLYESGLTEADGSRFFGQFASNRRPQRRLLAGIGHWLVAAGRHLQRYGIRRLDERTAQE